MDEAKRTDTYAIHLYLTNKHVVTFVEQFDTEDEFTATVDQFGLDATEGVLIGGKDEHGNEVVIPGHNVIYVKGVRL